MLNDWLNTREHSVNDQVSSEYTGMSHPVVYLRGEKIPHGDEHVCLLPRLTKLNLELFLADGFMVRYKHVVGFEFDWRLSS